MVVMIRQAVSKTMTTRERAAENKKMHYTAYSLLTYDNMDSRQTTMIWTDVGEQTMDDDDDGGMVVSMPWDQIKACRGSVETENEA